jgi:hypothetical protein
MGEEEREARYHGWRGVIAAHPVIFGFTVTCISVGAVMGVFLLTDEWSVARRVAAGIVGGAGVSILITAPRIIG